MSKLAHIGWILLIGAAQAFAGQADTVDSQWLLSKYDLNGDTKITQDEVSHKRQAIFSYMDANGDGQISFKEYTTIDSLKRQTILKARFNKLDRDLDGEVTQAEYQSYSGQFNAIDSDGDGTLTSSELNKTREVAKTRSTRCMLWFCVRTSLDK